MRLRFWAVRGLPLLLTVLAPQRATAAMRHQAAAEARPVTTVFEDPQGRFTLGLPPGWSFAPQPGDTGGVYFRRIADGIPANATVRVMQFSMPIELTAFAARIAAASDQEPGFHLLQSERALIAGQTGIKRRFVVSINGDRRFTKVVEQRIVVVDHFKGYVLHVETLADAFGTFAADFAAMFAHFSPVTAAAPLPTAELEHVHRLHRRQLWGIWVGGGHKLQLTPGGHVVLDEQAGRYRLDGGTLICKFGAHEQVFTISLSGAVLQLGGGIFAAGQEMTRQATTP